MGSPGDNGDPFALSYRTTIRMTDAVKHKLDQILETLCWLKTSSVAEEISIFVA